MTWPRACAHCGSTEIQSAVHEVLCLACGMLTDALGRVVPSLVQFTSTAQQEEDKK